MKEIIDTIKKYSKKLYVWMGIILLVLIIIPSTPKEEAKEVIKDSTDIVEEITNDNVSTEETVPEITETVATIPNESTQETYYNVVSVVDGDTVKVSMNGKTETLRLIGIEIGRAHV